MQSTAALLGGELRSLPGYDDTPLITNFAAAADALAASVPAGSALLGWSLGGTLALAAAARHPGHIGRVITVGSTASFIQREEWPHAERREDLASFTAAIETDAQAMLPRFVGNFNRGDRQAKTLTRRILQEIGTLPPLATLEAGLHWLANFDIRPLLPTIRCPVLLMVGASDPLVPLAAAEAMTAALPDARLTVMADCAHSPFLSDPETFAAHVREFLA
jgi:pimeloyl-[acyl-carrier protein] methyl ester esterase